MGRSKSLWHSRDLLGKQTVIDLASETLLTIEQAAERLIVSTTTVHRWITHGSNGVRLEAAKVGSCWRTSEQAIQRFSDRLTPKHESTPSPEPPVSTSKEMKQRVELMRQRLDEMFGVRRCETCNVEIVAPKGQMPKHERLWCPKCLVQRRSASIGLRIRTFRWAAMLSKQKLSEQARISIETIRSYEFNEKKPSEAHLAKLIEVLGEEMMTNLDPMPASTDG
jgi:excisionase family DNA binding protein